MIFPEFIKEGVKVGVIAPSGGVTDELKKKRFLNAKENLTDRNIKTLISGNVFTDREDGRSADAIVRAKDYAQMLSDPEIKAIYSAAGGDFMMEILPLLNFDMISEFPKWFQGYSDNTNLIYTLVTKADTAAIYGHNFGDFGMEKWHRAIEDSFDLITGKKREFHSYESYEDGWYDYETGLEGYHEDKRVSWECRFKDKVIPGMSVNITGRMIGGCFDVISYLLGTPYDGGREFVSKYKKDGIIWVLESFDTADNEMITKLWQMREMGYFEGCVGFVFGRELMFRSNLGLSYQDAIMQVLGPLNVPVIFGADVGHKAPCIPIVMGAVANVKCFDQKGVISYEF